MVAKTSSCSTVLKVEIVRPLQNLTFSLTTNEVTCPCPLCWNICLSPFPSLPFSFRPLILKGQSHEIFFFRFFSWITFPQAPVNNTRVVSNFFQSSRRYWQVKVVCTTYINDTSGKGATGVNDTGGAPWAANISANFRKNRNGPLMVWGLRETDSWKNLKPTSLRRLAQRKLQGTIKCKIWKRSFLSVLPHLSSMAGCIFYTLSLAGCAF